MDYHRILETTASVLARPLPRIKFERCRNYCRPNAVHQCILKELKCCETTCKSGKLLRIVLPMKSNFRGVINTFCCSLDQNYFLHLTPVVSNYCRLHINRRCISIISQIIFRSLL